MSVKTFQSELNKLRTEVINTFAHLIVIIGRLCVALERFLYRYFNGSSDYKLKGLKDNPSLKRRGTIRGVDIKFDLNQRGKQG